MLDLTADRGKVILSWVQVGWMLTTAFALGIIWNDIQAIKKKLDTAVYTRQEIDLKMLQVDQKIVAAHESNVVIDRYLYSEIKALQEKR